VAVVYLTGGLPAVLGVVDRHLGPAFEGLASRSLDHKTRLQQLTHGRMKVAPRYQVVAETGPDHDKQFEVEVLLGEQAYGRGVGRSKKEAEQAAALVTLGMLEQPSPA
jgi:ribonuclease-3